MVVNAKILDFLINYHNHLYFAGVVAYIREKDLTRKQALKKEILEETVDYFFSRFERELQKNNGYFGGKVILYSR